MAILFERPCGGRFWPGSRESMPSQEEGNAIAAGRLAVKEKIAW